MKTPSLTNPKNRYLNIIVIFLISVGIISGLIMVLMGLENLVTSIGLEVISIISIVYLYYFILTQKGIRLNPIPFVILLLDPAIPFAVNSLFKLTGPTGPIVASLLMILPLVITLTTEIILGLILFIKMALDL